MPTQTEQAKVFPSPMAGAIRPRHNWHELVTTLNQTEILDEKINLLHRGFTVSLYKIRYGEPEYDRIDRLIVYFTFANGWADDRLLRTPGPDPYCVFIDESGEEVRKSKSELRQKVAQKAFEQLCSKFFTMEHKGGGRYCDDSNEDWERLVVTERLFPVIQNFWRAEEEYGRTTITNLRQSRLDKPSHQEEREFSFLVNLANFMWSWHERDPLGRFLNAEEKEKFKKWNAEMRIRIDTAKPWMVEILNQLNRLDVLEKRMLLLEDSCIEKLKEIALRRGFSQNINYQWVGKDRKAETVDEALLLGSKAAMFLKRVEVMRKEHKRLSKIRELERGAEAAQAKLERIRGKRK